jgi:hypothetical protein
MPTLRHVENRADADRCLPDRLRMYRLRHYIATEDGRLSRILLLRVRTMSIGAVGLNNRLPVQCAGPISNKLTVHLWGHMHGVNAALHESAFGTKRTSRGWVPMSAFGGKADIKRMRCNVCF